MTTNNTNNLSKFDRLIVSETETAISKQFVAVECFKWIKRIFKDSTATPHQFQIDCVHRLLNSGDVFLMQPTGVGKTLCVELFVIIRSVLKLPGTVVVISPLTFVMREQFSVFGKHCEAAGLTLKAGVLGTTDQTKETQFAFESGKLDLIWVAPEFFLQDHYLKKIVQLSYGPSFGCFFVDEMHMTTEEGRTYRLHYRHLDELRVKFPKVPICGMSGTVLVVAEPEIKRSISLKQDTLELVGEFNRPNIKFIVNKSRSTYARDFAPLKKQVQRFRVGGEGTLEELTTSQPVMIYLDSKKAINDLFLFFSDGLTTSPKLKNGGNLVVMYTSSSSDAQQQQVQANLDSNPHFYGIILCTSALGTGCNFKMVLECHHYYFPTALSTFIQEAFRLGRSTFRHTKHILWISKREANHPPVFDKPDDVLQAGFANIVAYIAGRSCRRKLLLSWYMREGPSVDELVGGEGCCDVCEPEVAAQKALGGMTLRRKTVKSVQERAEFGNALILAFAEQGFDVPLAVIQAMMQDMYGLESGEFDNTLK